MLAYVEKLFWPVVSGLADSLLRLNTEKTPLRQLGWKNKTKQNIRLQERFVNNSLTINKAASYTQRCCILASVILSIPLSTFSWSSPPFSTFILNFTSRTFSILVANSISHTYSHAPCPPVSYPPQTHTLLPKMHCPAACLPFHWPIKQPELYGFTDSKYINYREREREREGWEGGVDAKWESTWGLWPKTPSSGKEREVTGE